MCETLEECINLEKGMMTEEHRPPAASACAPDALPYLWLECMHDGFPVSQSLSDGHGESCSSTLCILVIIYVPFVLSKAIIYRYRYVQ